ncbi:hypothetical protein BC830DRAFT_1163684 [Chytriomyces sp. MP71]|nr:hypothetical protein BC830DRAFT_1163684 [Chytriomyces sp. MP71]
MSPNRLPLDQLIASAKKLPPTPLPKPTPPLGCSIKCTYTRALQKFLAPRTAALHPTPGYLNAAGFVILSFLRHALSAADFGAIAGALANGFLQTIHFYVHPIEESDAIVQRILRALKESGNWDPGTESLSLDEFRVNVTAQPSMDFNPELGSTPKRVRGPPASASSGPILRSRRKNKLSKQASSSVDVKVGPEPLESELSPHSEFTSSPMPAISTPSDPSPVFEPPKKSLQLSYADMESLKDSEELLEALRHDAHKPIPEIDASRPRLCLQICNTSHFREAVSAILKAGFASDCDDLDCTHETLEPTHVVKRFFANLVCFEMGKQACDALCGKGLYAGKMYGGASFFDGFDHMFLALLFLPTHTASDRHLFLSYPTDAYAGTIIRELATKSGVLTHSLAGGIQYVELPITRSGYSLQVNLAMLTTVRVENAMMQLR